jgi:hypothetical protein
MKWCKYTRDRGSPESSGTLLPWGSNARTVRPRGLHPTKDRHLGKPYPATVLTTEAYFAGWMTEQRRKPSPHLLCRPLRSAIKSQTCAPGR